MHVKGQMMARAGQNNRHTKNKRPYNFCVNLLYLTHHTHTHTHIMLPSRNCYIPPKDFKYRTPKKARIRSTVDFLKS